MDVPVFSDYALRSVLLKLGRITWLLLRWFQDDIFCKCHIGAALPQVSVLHYDGVYVKCLVRKHHLCHVHRQLEVLLVSLNVTDLQVSMSHQSSDS